MADPITEMLNTLFNQAVVQTGPPPPQPVGGLYTPAQILNNPNLAQQMQQFNVGLTTTPAGYDTTYGTPQLSLVQTDVLDSLYPYYAQLQENQRAAAANQAGTQQAQIYANAQTAAAAASAEAQKQAAAVSAQAQVESAKIGAQAQIRAAELRAQADVLMAKANALAQFASARTAAETQRAIANLEQVGIGRQTIAAMAQDYQNNMMNAALTLTQLYQQGGLRDAFAGAMFARGLAPQQPDFGSAFPGGTLPDFSNFQKAFEGPFAFLPEAEEAYVGTFGNIAPQVSESVPNDLDLSFMDTFLRGF